MKTTIITLLMLFTAFHLKAQIPTPTLTPNSTNADYTTNNQVLQLNSLAGAVGALRANMNDIRTQTDTLQHKMDRIETGVMIMVIIFVITVVAMCFLNAKNRPVMNRYASDQKAAPPEGR